MCMCQTKWIPYSLLFPRGSEASRLIMCPSHWRVTHIWKHVSIIHTDNTTIWRSSALSKWRQFSGEGKKPLVKAIKHYRLSRGTPFERNIKAWTINKSIFLASARLELWQVNFPIETEVSDTEGAAGRLCNKQTSRQAVITSTEQRRQKAVLEGVFEQGLDCCMDLLNSRYSGKEEISFPSTAYISTPTVPL